MHNPEGQNVKRTVKDILEALTDSERKVLAEIIDEERRRLAQQTARDMGDEIVRSLGRYIQ